MSDLAKIVGELGDIDEFVVNDEFLQIVNQEPPKQHVYDHPLARGVKYIPIQVVETMLTKLFQNWNIEVLREGQLLNSIYVTIRLHYKHPITKEMTFQDGIGAVQIQVDKGENASNLSAIKPNAVMLGLPAAKSFAIKDAAEHIGKVFGRDINRKEAVAFSPSYANSAAGLKDSFYPTNKRISVEQRRELVEVTKEASGLAEEKAIELWFEETCGMKIDQVKSVEFDLVVAHVKDNSY